VALAAGIADSTVLDQARREMEVKKALFPGSALTGGMSRSNTLFGLSFRIERDEALPGRLDTDEGSEGRNACGPDETRVRLRH
jgi:hypothetical protein